MPQRARLRVKGSGAYRAAPSTAPRNPMVSLHCLCCGGKLPFINSRANTAPHGQILAAEHLPCHSRGAVKEIHQPFLRPPPVTRPTRLRHTAQSLGIRLAESLFVSSQHASQQDVRNDVQPFGEYAQTVGNLYRVASITLGTVANGGDHRFQGPCRLVRQALPSRKLFLKILERQKDAGRSPVRAHGRMP